VRRIRTARLLLPAALVVFWSSGFIGATMAAATGAAASTTLLWRYLLTAAVLVSIALTRRRRYALGFLVREATIGLFAQSLYLYGVFRAATLGVPTGTNALIASLQPLLVAGIVSRQTGARLDGRSLLGLAAGLGGVSLVTGADLGAGRGGSIGIGMVTLGMVALSIGTVIDGRWSRHAAADLVDRLTVQAVLALGFFIALALPSHAVLPPAEPMFWLAEVVVVLFAFVGGYGSYLMLLERSGPVLVSALLYLTPGASAALAYLLLNESLARLTLVGFAVSALGVVVLFRSPALPLGRRRRRSTHPGPARRWIKA
jgi:drug/metabolite transporter (DMT)-like permease